MDALGKAITSPADGLAEIAVIIDDTDKRTRAQRRRFDGVDCLGRRVMPSIPVVGQQTTTDQYGALSKAAPDSA